jgi:hypothetical protein
MDVEVLLVETEAQLLFEHYDLNENSNFSDLLNRYFEVLVTGTAD